MSRRRPGGAVGAGLLVAALAACGGAGDGAVQRGDRLLGAGQVDAAVAEYKLALRRDADAPDVLLRLGAAYGGRGEVEAALRYLRRALERDSTLRYQVAAELADAARAARERGALDNMARALEPVLELGLGLVPPDLVLELARYHADLGDHARALPLFLAAVESDTAGATAWYETARALKELGACREALDWFERYLEAGGKGADGETGARWHYGDCLWEVARAEREAGSTAGARRVLDRLIELGVPRALLDRAHLARGELRLGAGEVDGAEADFLAVLELNPARSGPLVRRAEDRLREIRYGYR